MAKKKNNNNKKSSPKQGNDDKTEQSAASQTTGEVEIEVDGAESTISNGTQESSQDQDDSSLNNEVGHRAPETENEEGTVDGEPLANGGEEGKDEKSVEVVAESGEDQLKHDEQVKDLERQISELKLQLHQANETKESNDINAKEDSEEVVKLKEELKTTAEERDKVQVQYEGLLNRLGSMKSVFEKMKASQVELEETKEQLEEYEKQNLQLKQKVELSQREAQHAEKTVAVLREESESLNAECDRLSEEMRLLRNESENKETIWQSEKQKLTVTNHKLEMEIEKLKQSNEEYIITLENDKVVNSSLNSDITDLMENISNLKSTIAELETENESLKSSKSSLRSDLKKLQADFDNVTQKHLSSVQTLEKELESQRTQYETIKQQNSILEQENSKASRFEQEVKEKQLQIGKLRHEAVILNEHLTKALQLIKRNSDAETVDKELVTNLFISFLSFPRGDTKKFEVLQLISNYLNWDEEKRIQAGLSHNATASKTKQARESFVSLWTEYLESESLGK